MGVMGMETFGRYVTEAEARLVQSALASHEIHSRIEGANIPAAYGGGPGSVLLFVDRADFDVARDVLRGSRNVESDEVALARRRRLRRRGVFLLVVIFSLIILLVIMGLLESAN